MRIIPRNEWGARYPDGFRSAPIPAREVWLHHSVTVAPDLLPPFDDDDAAMRTLERIGQQRFGGGISYTFAITPVGRIYEGHGIGRQGAHTGGRNSISRAICLIGNYDTARPTREQLDAVAWLLREGKTRGWWQQARLTGGHRDAPGASTACPGRHAHAAIAEINRRAEGPVTVLEDRQMTLDELLNTSIKREGPGAKGDTTLRAVLAWSDSNLRALREGVAADVRGDLARIEAKLDQLAAVGDVAALAERVTAAIAGIEVRLVAAAPESSPGSGPTSPG